MAGETQQKGKQLIGQIVRRFGARESGKICDLILQQAGKELELAAKLPVDGLLRHSGRLRDGVHGRLFGGAVEKDAPRGRKDALPECGGGNVILVAIQDVSST